MLEKGEGVTVALVITFLSMKYFSWRGVTSSEVPAPLNAKRIAATASSTVVPIAHFICFDNFILLCLSAFQFAFYIRSLRVVSPFYFTCTRPFRFVSDSETALASIVQGEFLNIHHSDTDSPVSSEDKGM